MNFNVYRERVSIQLCETQCDDCVVAQMFWVYKPPYSLLSTPLQQMSTTAGFTGKTYLDIDPNGKWISFPFKDKDGNWFKGTVTLENFIWACSSPGVNLQQKLVEKSAELSKYFGGETFDMGTPDSQKKFFREFLKVIYQFLQLGV